MKQNSMASGGLQTLRSIEGIPDPKTPQRPFRGVQSQVCGHSAPPHLPDPTGAFSRLSCRSRLWWARPSQCTCAWAAEFSWMLQTSQSVYDGRFLSRLGLGGSGARGGHSAAPDIGGSFSVEGDGLSGRFIPKQIERETNK